jgi:hypothetical protein
MIGWPVICDVHLRKQWWPICQTILDFGQSLWNTAGRLNQDSKFCQSYSKPGPPEYKIEMLITWTLCTHWKQSVAYNMSTTKWLSSPLHSFTNSCNIVQYMSEQQFRRRMPSRWMLCHVGLVRTDVSEDRNASIIIVFLHSVHRLLVTANVVLAHWFLSPWW